MVDYEQVIDGLIRFIKNELMPVLPNSAKVLAGAVLIRNASRMPGAAMNIINSGTAKTLGIVTETGIDVDQWAHDIKESMREYTDGKLEISLPLIKPIILDQGDIDTLRRYMKGEL